MKRTMLPAVLAIVLIPASAALAGGRWSGSSAGGTRGYNYDRGERYSGGGSRHSSRGGWHGGSWWGGSSGWSSWSDCYAPRSSISIGFSFNNSGRYGDYWGGYSGRYGGFYDCPPTVVYRDVYYNRPPVRVYAPPPPPVVYYPSPRVYYYDGCSTGSSFSIGGSYYYRR